MQESLLQGFYNATGAIYCNANLRNVGINISYMQVWSGEALFKTGSSR